MIVFAKESVTAALLAEAIPLLRAHWKEVAHYEDIPLDVDVERYLAMEQAGVIRCFTARSYEGVFGVPSWGILVGYALYFVNYNMHYQTSLQAVQDVLYMDPSHRGKTSYKFIRWCDEQLQSEGVQATYQHMKVAHDAGKRLLERLGYERVDEIWAKRLDDARVMGKDFEEQHAVDEQRTIPPEIKPALTDWANEMLASGKHFVEVAPCQGCGQQAFHSDTCPIVKSWSLS